MGTTMTAALVDAARGEVAIGHVGDSRAYLLRGGVLKQLTTDHSLVAELVQSGVLTPEEAESHPQRSAITRALGTEPTVEVEVLTIAPEPGDLFLLCSDGLQTMVSDDEIIAALEAAERAPAPGAEALVAAANARGGEDNVTVVLFELIEGENRSDEEESPEQASVTESEPHVQHMEEPALEASATTLSRHGAGPGGRVAALLLIAAVVVIGVLALFWGTTR